MSRRERLNQVIANRTSAREAQYIEQKNFNKGRGGNKILIKVEKEEDTVESYKKLYDEIYKTFHEEFKDDFANNEDVKKEGVDEKKLKPYAEKDFNKKYKKEFKQNFDTDKKDVKEFKKDNHTFYNCDEDDESDDKYFDNRQENKYNINNETKYYSDDEKDKEDLEYALIPLTTGGYMKISKQDVNKVSQYSWGQHLTSGYIKGTINNKSVLCHRFIMDAPKGMKVDHINENENRTIFQDRSDNRRENLRITDSTGNSRNKKKMKGTTSKYYGICYNKKISLFIAQITVDGKHIFLGSFDNEIEAVEFRDVYIIQNNLENFRLNFPSKKDEYLLRNKIILKPQTSSSGFIGVKIDKRHGSITSSIQINRKKIYLGTFDTHLEAACAYDKYIVDNNLSRKKLNFPDDNPEYDYYNDIRTFYEDIGNNIYKVTDGILISKESYDKVKNYTISVFRNKDDRVFSNINHKSGSYILSRFLLNITDPDIWVDHINSNTLDNTLSNLRISDVQSNGENKAKHKNARSKYYGVSKGINKNYYDAAISNNNIKIFTFTNKNEIICARAHDLFLIKFLPKSCYKINFHDWDNTEVFNYWNDILKNMFEKNKSVNRFIQNNNKTKLI